MIPNFKLIKNLLILKNKPVLKMFWNLYPTLFDFVLFICDKKQGWYLADDYTETKHTVQIFYYSLDDLYICIRCCLGTRQTNDLPSRAWNLWPCWNGLPLPLKHEVTEDPPPLESLIFSYTILTQTKQTKEKCWKAFNLILITLII